MYVKTLPILMDCRNQKVDAFLSYASDLMNSVMKYDLVPFRTLASGYELNAGTTFQYAHSLYMDTLNRYGQSLKLEPLPQDPDAELSFYVFDNEDDGLILRIKSSSRYSEDFIQRFAESYEMILRSMMTAERMQEISYISTKDLSLLNGWNQTEAKLPYGHILEAFRDTLSKYPEGYILYLCRGGFYRGSDPAEASFAWHYAGGQSRISGPPFGAVYVLRFRYSFHRCSLCSVG